MRRGNSLASGHYMHMIVYMCKCVCLPVHMRLCVASINFHPYSTWKASPGSMVCRLRAGTLDAEIWATSHCTSSVPPPFAHLEPCLSSGFGPGNMPPRVLINLTINNLTICSSQWDGRAKLGVEPQRQNVGAQWAGLLPPAHSAGCNGLGRVVPPNIKTLLMALDGIRQFPHAGHQYVSLPEPSTDLPCCTVPKSFSVQFCCPYGVRP